MQECQCIYKALHCLYKQSMVAEPIRAHARPGSPALSAAAPLQETEEASASLGWHQSPCLGRSVATMTSLQCRTREHVANSKCDLFWKRASRLG